jgi:hypothetical protein
VSSVLCVDRTVSAPLPFPASTETTESTRPGFLSFLSTDRKDPALERARRQKRRNSRATPAGMPRASRVVHKKCPRTVPAAGGVVRTFEEVTNMDMHNPALREER